MVRSPTSLAARVGFGSAMVIKSVFLSEKTLFVAIRR